MFGIFVLSIKLLSNVEFGICFSIVLGYWVVEIIDGELYFVKVFWKLVIFGIFERQLLFIIKISYFFKVIDWV